MKWQIIPTGRVWVDPGGAFGLVPRSLWEKHQIPNHNNLIPMDLNSLLVQTAGKIILIDTGIGEKLSDKAAGQWGLEWPEGSLLKNLAANGISPEDVDIVIDTHLHSDHCGGNTVRLEDRVAPAFPNAEYFVQRIEFAEAYNSNSRTRATYLPENFIPLWEAGQLTLLNGNTEIVPGVRCEVTRGHTRGHQSIIIEDRDGPVLFVSDLASYAAHFIRAAWVAAYDVEPQETIASKEIWQAWALEQNARLVFQHDTVTRMGRLQRNVDGRLGMELLAEGSLGNTR